MDWAASDIQNSFEYEMIDPFDLDMSLGFIEGVTGGKITESYRGDYRSTASIDIDGASVPANALVRIWHIAEQGGEQVREELGTFMQGKPSARYRYGRRVTSLPLYSTLYRLGTDLVPAETIATVGSNVLDTFNAMVADAGGTPPASSSIDPASTFASKVTWPIGTSVLSKCHSCASAIGGRIEADAHGRTIIEPYQSPSKRADSFSLVSGESAATYVGVNIVQSDWRNHVIASAEVDGTSYVASAKVDVSHPLHRRRIGRWNTEHVELTNFEDGADIQEILDVEAAYRLAQLCEAYDTYNIEMLYRPISCGEVGTFWYADAPDDEGLCIRGLVTQREIKLDAVMAMSLTIEEVAT